MWGGGREKGAPAPCYIPPPLALKQSFLYLKQREYILYTIYSIYPVKLFISTSLPGGGGGGSRVYQSPSLPVGGGIGVFIHPPLSQEGGGRGVYPPPNKTSYLNPFKPTLSKKK